MNDDDNRAEAAKALADWEMARRAIGVPLSSIEWLQLEKEASLKWLEWAERDPLAVRAFCDRRICNSCHQLVSFESEVASAHFRIKAAEMYLEKWRLLDILGPAPLVRRDAP